MSDISSRELAMRCSVALVSAVRTAALPPAPASRKRCAASVPADSRSRCLIATSHARRVGPC
eukprot:359011-Chlamydomonas_euryale.AAC.1